VCGTEAIYRHATTGAERDSEKKSRQAPIRPLIENLDFIRNKRSWAHPFHFGMVSISEKDFRTIADAMGVSQG
jgi:hypothetical protein